MPKLNGEFPLSKYDNDSGRVNEQSSDSQNDHDRDATAENPNAQGPQMRAVYDACAGIPNYPADGHDTYEAPYPRIQRGAVANGVGSSAERKDGPGGRF